MGLPSIWTLAAVTIGGGLFGVLGMILGVPLTATLYKLSFRVLENKEEKLGIASPGSNTEKSAEKKASRPKKQKKSKKK